MGRMRRVGNVHIGHCPVPEGVEIGFAIQLDGNHHAVRHPFSSYVMVCPVCEIAEWTVRVTARCEDYGLIFRIAMKELLVGSIDLCLNLRGRVSCFREEITVVAGRIGTLTVA